MNSISDFFNIVDFFYEQELKFKNSLFEPLSGFELTSAFVDFLNNINFKKDSEYLNSQTLDFNFECPKVFYNKNIISFSISVLNIKYTLTVKYNNIDTLFNKQSPNTLKINILKTDFPDSDTTEFLHIYKNTFTGIIEKFHYRYSDSEYSIEAKINGSGENILFDIRKENIFEDSNMMLKQIHENIRTFYSVENFLNSEELDIALIQYDFLFNKEQFVKNTNFFKEKLSKENNKTTHFNKNNSQ